MPEDTNETLMETYNMINDLNIDEPTVTNVVPFPGTKLLTSALEIAFSLMTLIYLHYGKTIAFI